LAFTNIEYNYKSNKIHLWECYDGKRVKSEEDFVNEYYVQCNESEASVHDVYKTPMKLQVGGSKSEIQMVKESGIKVAESDIQPTIKYLQKKYHGANIKPDINNFNICFIDIEIAGEGEFPEPAEAKYPINLITVKSSKTGKVTTFGSNEYTGDSELLGDYYCIPDEERMLKKFAMWFRKQKFDIITGWNVLDFDMHYIFQRNINLSGSDDINKAYSPVNRVKRSNTKKKDKKTGRVTETIKWSVSGVSILDYLELYKNFTFDTKVSYSLQSIGVEECGEGKIELDGSINDIWKTNWNQFVEYNIQDVLLVELIDNKMQFMNLCITFAYKALIPFDKVTSAIATSEGIMLQSLHNRKLVMPDRKSGIVDWWIRDEMYKVPQENGSTYIQNRPPKDKGNLPFDKYVKGGHVQANPGFYKHVLSDDVESLYPRMIEQYNISPETKVINPTQAQKDSGTLIESEINGIWYDKTEKGVFPEIISELFAIRKAYKQEMFKHKKGTVEYGEFQRLQHCYKIALNSIYGISINEFFHFYDVDNARAITRGGRVLIRYLSETTNDYFQSNFHKVGPKLFPGAEPQKLTKHITALIDTDSCYYCLDEIKSKYAHQMPFPEFAIIMEEFIGDFHKKILQIKADKKGMDQYINFEREGVITKMFILAKKKYLTELIQNEDDFFDPPFLKVTGVEIKKSDTPSFCREWIAKAVMDIFDNMDKDKNYKMIKKIYKDFVNQPIDKIASVSSAGKFNDYSIGYDINKFKTGTMMHYKASMYTNHIIKEKKLPYMPISQGSKLKYIRTVKNNQYHAESIAWIGNYPEEFHNIFKPDYELQFKKTALGVLERMWIVLGWTDKKTGIKLKKSKLNGFLS
tara:strand:+ start:11957 stop:14539 length:2583 start_codon:yes stop_codon:yes gene_type:complete